MVHPTLLVFLIYYDLPWGHPLSSHDNLFHALEDLNVHGKEYIACVLGNVFRVVFFIQYFKIKRQNKAKSISI